MNPLRLGNWKWYRLRRGGIWYKVRRQSILQSILHIPGILFVREKGRRKDDEVIKKTDYDRPWFG